MTAAALAQLRRHGLPLTIISIATLCAIFSHAANPLLRFDRSAVMTGQWWRLLTGNLVHLTWGHWALNIAGLVMVWALFHRYLSNLQWWTTLVVSGLAVTLGLLWLDPQLQWYVGLSGALHGLFAAAVLVGVARGNRMDGLMALLIAAKLGWEQVMGPTPGTSALAGGPVVVDSHLYGAIGGALTGVMVILSERKKPTPNDPA